MTMTTLTALYDTRTEADQAVTRLTREAGVATTDVSVIAQEASTAATAGEDQGFFASLKAMFMPDDDRQAYSEAIRRGGFLLTARIDQGQAERAMDILEEHGAVDLDGRRETWQAEGRTASQSAMGAQALADGTVVATAATTTMAGTAAAPAATAQAAATGEEETIALAEERLRVGKRAVEGGRVRVRSYVVETPVEQQVTLHEENVAVERRAVDRPVTEADQAAFRDRTIEATATAEEAVVSKTAHVVEEVVVSKGVEERVETVRDTVRRTEIEVEDDRVPGAKGAAPGSPQGRTDPMPRR